MVPAELIRAFLDGETSIVAHDIGVSAGAVLTINNHVSLDIASVSFIDAEGVEASRIASDVGCRGLQLRRWLVADRESAIIVSDVLISIVTACTEPLLEAVAFINKNWLVVAGAMHLFSVAYQILNLNKIIEDTFDRKKPCFFISLTFVLLKPILLKINLPTQQVNY